MIATLKALSLLLCYPNAELCGGAPELSRAIREEALLGRFRRRRLTAFLDEFAAADLYELQERYVQLFDRTRSLSLHLFEHIHGDSRARGQALVDLAGFYERHGFRADRRELPDYLPLFLEFAALRPLAEARHLLGEPRQVIGALERRLDARGSGYACVFAAIGALSDQPAGSAALRANDAIDDDPEDLDALDRAWAEAPVAFGPSGLDQGGGRSCRSADPWSVHQQPQPSQAVRFVKPTQNRRP